MNSNIIAKGTGRANFVWAKLFASRVTHFFNPACQSETTIIAAVPTVLAPGRIEPMNSMINGQWLMEAVVHERWQDVF